MAIPETIAAILTLMALGVVIHVALRLAYSGTNSRIGDPVYLILSTTGWVVMGLSSAVLLWLATGPFAILLLIIAAVALISAYRQRNLTRRHALMSVLAISAEKGLPLAPSVAAWAESDSGFGNDAADELAESLMDGAPLSDALTEYDFTVTEFAPLFARIGSQTDSMGRAMREAISVESFGHTLWDLVVGRLAYLFGFSFVGQVVVLFMMIKIVPTFRKIATDFGIESTWPGSLVTSGYGWDYALSWIFGHLLMVTSIGLIVTTLGYLRIIRSLPLLDRILTRKHSAVILRALALTVDKNGPLLETLRIAAEEYPRRFIRKRLDAVVEDVEQGGSWSESLAQHRLIDRSDAAVLQSAERVGNLAWALRGVAETGLLRLGCRIRAIIELAFPIAVACAGLLVLALAVILFAPMVQILWELV